MDEVGIDVFAMGEHHRADDAVSSPEIILATAASIT
ncbi:alkanesulfonate monooxygenase SsuD/methylene tetrahydromethanopterin reductase-like flavin-dependent oxidoreductase (luciferase family) [Chryseobacterium sp. MP_3.2]|nr:alkanesulfonate monooxygenase SsuD/methylene tetrahydromethanopterin reductase-like flavin-dependent oxidoreductase (luciferase family) [Chryseobacterium sp. MP_3.2]